MSKSLADLRATPPAARPERTIRVCLAPDLVGKMQAAAAELTTLTEGTAKHKRQTNVIKAMLKEIEEHEGDLTLRGNLSDGEWRQWADAHPAREEGKPGHDRDQRYVSGMCDSDALIEDLARYAHAWNGESLGEGDWAALFAPVIAHGDKIEAAKTVVAIYEGRVDFQVWRTALSASLSRSSTSD